MCIYTHYTLKTLHRLHSKNNILHECKILHCSNAQTNENTRVSYLPRVDWVENSLKNFDLDTVTLNYSLWPWRTHTHTHTHTGPRTLPLPLTPEVNIYLINLFDAASTYVLTQKSYSQANFHISANNCQLFERMNLVEYTASVQITGAVMHNSKTVPPRGTVTFKQVYIHSWERWLTPRLHLHV